MPGAGRRRRRRKRSIANATSLAVFKLIQVTLFSLKTDAILMYSTTPLCVHSAGPGAGQQSAGRRVPAKPVLPRSRYQRRTNHSRILEVRQIGLVADP